MKGINKFLILLFYYSILCQYLMGRKAFQKSFKGDFSFTFIATSLFHLILLVCVSFIECLYLQNKFLP